jgi:hypothetical protein
MTCLNFGSADGSDEIGAATAVPIGARDPVGFAQYLLARASLKEHQ